MPRPRTDIRPRVIAAARERFLASGVDGASLRAIAREAGTSIGMIYYYFPTKDDLFLAVLEEGYLGFMSDLERALAEGDGFESRVRALYHRFAHMSPLEVDTLRLIVREALVSSERRERLIERFQRGHVAILLRVAAEGRREGVVTDEVPLPLVAIATGVLGAMPQVILRALGQRSPFGSALEPGDALVDQLLRLLLGGVGLVGAP